MRELVSLLATLAIAVAVLWKPTPRPVTSDERAAVLARLCVSEANWRTDLLDCPAIYEVLVNQAERTGSTWERSALAYSVRVYDAARTDPRAWVTHLPPHVGARSSAPAYWPSSASWARVGRPGWAARLEEAKSILRGELTHACKDGEPHHWGGPDVDRERIEAGIARGYWRPLDCGGTANAYLEVIAWTR